MRAVLKLALRASDSCAPSSRDLPPLLSDRPNAKREGDSVRLPVVRAGRVGFRSLCDVCPDRQFDRASRVSTRRSRAARPQDQEPELPRSRELLPIRWSGHRALRGRSLQSHATPLSRGCQLGNSPGSDRSLLDSVRFYLGSKSEPRLRAGRASWRSTRRAQTSLPPRRNRVRSQGRIHPMERSNPPRAARRIS